MLLAAIFHAPHPKIIVHSSAAPPFQTEPAPLGFDQLIAGVSPDTARPAVGAHSHRHVSSVATHWLPYILQAFSRDYPGIDCELLPGRAHISAATRQLLRYLDRRNAPEAPAGCTGFDNQA